VSVSRRRYATSLGRIGEPGAIACANKPCRQMPILLCDLFNECSGGLFTTSFARAHRERQRIAVWLLSEILPSSLTNALMNATESRQQRFVLRRFSGLPSRPPSRP